MLKFITNVYIVAGSEKAKCADGIRLYEGIKCDPEERIHCEDSSDQIGCRK